MCEFGRIHSTDELLESRFSQQETVCKKVFCIAGKIFRNNDRVKILVIRIFSAWGVWSHKNQDWDRCKSIDYQTNHYDILVNHVIPACTDMYSIW